MTAPNSLRMFSARLLAAAEAIEAADTHPGAIARRANAALAREFYRLRRTRTAIFGDRLFFEPAWDMLLELYASEGEERDVATSSLCAASGAPSTTALRYLAELERAGLIQRNSSALDARVILVTLTDAGRARLDELVSVLVGKGPIPRR